MKNNKTLKKDVINKILHLIFIAFFGMITMMATIWWAIKIEYQQKQHQLMQQEIKSSIELYKSILSQKLSLIANSPLFIDFINSGPLTRKSLQIRFLTQISELNSGVITGMIINSNKNSIFSYGRKSRSFITLNLCYLNQELNFQYGDCHFTWKLYLNKNLLLSNLSKINKNLVLYEKKSAQSIDIFKGDHFGIFTISEKSPIIEKISIKQKNSYLNSAFILFVIMALLMGGGLYFMINKTMSDNLSAPIKSIITSLKKGNLPETKEYIEEFIYLCNQIFEYYKEKDKIAIAKIASQAAHDIRSPLAALEIATKKISSLSEKENLLIRNATRQIKDIANNLLQKNINKESIVHNEMKNAILIPIIEYAISEKSMELSEKNLNIQIERKISESSYTIFINVIPLSLKRILSNLLNNAIEAIGDKQGKIVIESECKNNQAIITIKDDGPGIPSDIFNQIFKEGISSKNNGTGLGLYHAKTNIEKWGGTITAATTKQNSGTSITIVLPRKKTANWFAKQLDIPPGATVIIIDDSESIYDIWQQRFASQRSSHIRPTYFNTAKSFINWKKTLNSGNKNNFVYLIDYEFSQEKLNGMDIINEINSFEHTFLVTSHAENFDIQNKCAQLNIKLIPKYFIPFIPLHFK